MTVEVTVQNSDKFTEVKYRERGGEGRGGEEPQSCSYLN